MNKIINRWMETIWYQNNRCGFWLIPVAWMYRIIIFGRRLLYKYALKAEQFTIPIVVIGNISVGGTGKTPLLIWMAFFLQQQGYSPGIVSRGYGGMAQQWPQWVDANSDPNLVGDEALLIAKRSQCPMAVSPTRTEAVKMLQQKSQCDVILADDGLQHYALARDIEIAVIDGERRFGNARCLPAGPLREPVSRLQEVDLTIVNGYAKTGEYAMQINGNIAINLQTGIKKPLSDFTQNLCHAMAGIGNPQRFFKYLRKQGLSCEEHIFPDHHVYQADDIVFVGAGLVLMTEKDAVKCTAFAQQQHWYLPIKAQVDTTFAKQLLLLLREGENG